MTAKGVIDGGEVAGVSALPFDYAQGKLAPGDKGGSDLQMAAVLSGGALRSFAGALDNKRKRYYNR